jgi:hypothetical protein
MRFSPCHTPGNGDEADRGASKTRSCRACGQDDEEEELQRALMDRSHRGAVLLTLADLERTEGPCLGGCDARAVSWTRSQSQTKQQRAGDGRALLLFVHSGRLAGGH